MNLLKLIFKLAIVAALAFVVLTVAGKARYKKQAAEAARDATFWNEAGFCQIQQGVPKNQKVWVMAPPNCPSQQAQQARVLCASIQLAGVPCEISSAIEFNLADRDEAARVKKFMDNVANPLVVVRGWAKGNPTVAEVVAQYRATR